MVRTSPAVGWPEASRILVTGATGFVGRPLCARLIGELGENRVFRVVRQKTCEGEVAWDLRTPLCVDCLPVGITGIVHLATPRARESADPAAWADHVAVNVDATARLYAWAITNGVPQIVHVSTASVLAPRPMGSSAPCARLIWSARHAYATTKLWGERVAQAIVGSHRGLVVLRPTQVYGPDLPKSTIIGKWREAILKGLPIEIGAPNGHQLAPIHVDDLVDVIVMSLKTTYRAVFAVAGPEVLDERTIIEDLARVLQVRSILQTTPDVPAYSFAPSVSALNRRLPARHLTPWSLGVLTLG